jgi:hypothetical protein
MQNPKNAILHILLWLLLTLVSLSCSAQPQLSAQQYKNKATGSDVIACFSNRPCILWLRQNGGKLQIGWEGQGTYDTYILRWSEGGKAHQIKLQGGQGGTYELDNLNPHATYSLKIRGCKTLRTKRVRCSRWGTAIFNVESNLQLESLQSMSEVCPMSNDRKSPLRLGAEAD